MLTSIADLPAGVIGFEATGEIPASDYCDVLMPAVRHVWERGERNAAIAWAAADE